MRVRLEHTDEVSKKLADGIRVTYYYTWQGGPRLPGKPGDPEFGAAYNEAIVQKAKQPSGTIQAVLKAYQQAPKFIDLAERSGKGKEGRHDPDHDEGHRLDKSRVQRDVAQNPSQGEDHRPHLP